MPGAFERGTTLNLLTWVVEKGYDTDEPFQKYNARKFARGSTLAKPGYTGIRRIIQATRYSAQGFAHAWKYESAFRQELTLTVILIPFAIWLGGTPVEHLMLIGSCVLVLVVELLNSALEAAVDRFGDEQHELPGRAKDMGSAAVFLSLLIVAAVWTTVAWQRFVAPTLGA